MNELKKYFNNEYLYFLITTINYIIVIYFLNPGDVFVNGNELIIFYQY